MAAPTFGLDDDGEHVWWTHEHVTTWPDGETDTFLIERQMLPLGPPRGWTVEQSAPLTVSPSILCTGCGTHGFIRDGSWVPA